MEAEPDAPDPRPPAENPPPRPPLWRRFGVRVTAGVVGYVIVGAILLASVPDRLLANWFPDMDEHERAAFLGPAANVVLFALGGSIALVGVGLSLSRHRQELEAAERDRQRLIDDRDREQARRDEVEAQRRIDTERALRERFVTTVKLLSDPALANRQAALFALGALADDWDAFGNPDEVQVCIEVLTGYLRAPRTDDMLVPLTEEEHDQLLPDERRDAQRTTPQEVSVKQAGYSVISRHLARDADPNWHGRSINLEAAHIDFEVRFPKAKISDHGQLLFSGAVISGRGAVYMPGAEISGSGRVRFSGAKISGSGQVMLRNVKVSGGGEVGLYVAKISGLVDLSEAKISDTGRVHFSGAEISDTGLVQLSGVKISDRGLADLSHVEVRDTGRVNLSHVGVRDRGRVNLDAAKIRDGGLRGRGR